MLRFTALVFLLIFPLQQAAAAISLEVKAFLQGAYEPASGLHRDDLRRLDLLPATQPYSKLPFNYPGQEQLGEDLLTRTDASAPIDWLLLEIRDADNSELIHAQQAVLIRRDGQLMNHQGNTVLSFKQLEPDNYRVAIRHRNHLGVTSTPIDLMETGNIIDFTDLALDVTGENARAINGELALLWAGDANNSRQIIAQGPDNDSTTLLSDILADAENPGFSANFRRNGYHDSDLNLDGVTIYAGPNNDLNLITSNVLLHPANQTLSNNYILPGHLPALKRLDSALRTGNIALLDQESSLLDELLGELAQRKSTPDLLQTLYGNSAIQYDPGNRTQLLNPHDWVAGHFPILLGNKDKILAMAGETTTARYAAFGSIPTEYFQQDANLSFQQPFKNLLHWLTNSESPEASANPIIALSFTGGDRNDFKSWVQNELPNWTIRECNDATQLTECYADSDLIVTGWQGNNADAQLIRDTLENQMAEGRPVLYLHTWYEAYNDVAHAIADLLNFSLPYGGNYWAKDAADWNSATQMQEAIWSGPGLGSIEILLQHIKAEDFQFDWQGCTGSCQDTAGFQEGFLNGANKARQLFKGLDESRTNIFRRHSDAPRWLRLLVLLSDQLRQQSSFPMDKSTTNTTAFLKSLFADYAVYNYRPINPTQADMGNFSRSDFSHITPISKTISLTSKQHFRAAGVYVLPGQAVRITRHDSSSVLTGIRINTQRSGSTHEFENNGYKRPKFLQSPTFPISNGETIRITSPYGGPIQITFDGNDQEVEFSFTNVGEHPFWDGPEDDAVFTEALEAGDYDWAELVTPGFEVHSTLDKMRQSMADEKWGSAQALAAGTMRYVHNFPHILAGFRGPGIDVVDEIHDFATDNGFSIDNLDLVKHMNADQATCGYGCSGNPYDAYWSFSPVGHGDIHELGHGLEKARLRFNGWQVHTMTNPYSYYTKSQFHLDTNQEPECQNLPFEAMFDILQASIGEADPANYVQTQLWDTMGWSHGAGMFIQMMMAAEDQGNLENGWHLLARLHIMEREFNRAVADEASWLAKREALGFGSFTLNEVKALDNNDWLLIAISKASGLDHRDYFMMWAMPYGSVAADQVGSMNLPSVSRHYYLSSSNGYCKGEGFDGQKLPVDGTQSWPASYRSLPTDFQNFKASPWH